MTSIQPEEFLRSQAELGPEARMEALVSVLRGPAGCPWDQKQTANSMLDHLIDEAHELKQALAQGETSEIVGEFGDLAFTFTFLRQTLAEQAPFDQAVDATVAKMVQRHPHVFARESDQPQADEESIKRTWESLKKDANPENRRLDRDLPASLPTWKRAAKILSRARNSGFRYPNAEAAWDKVAEEWSELQESLENDDHNHQQAELGDLLLALLTATRESGLDPDLALDGAGKTFADRIERLESLSGSELGAIPYHELALWYTRAKDAGGPRSAFYNYCGVGLWPGQVSRAVHRAARRLSRSGLTAALELRLEREDLRGKIARLVEGQPENVVFVPNVSSAALAVGYCLDWRPGDAILLGSGEFPANTVPWRMAARNFELKVLEFDDDELRRDPDAGWSSLEALLRSERPRLLALSAVSYWSGHRLCLERLSKLCRNSGTRLYIDAIQALGTAPVSMRDGIDFLAAGSHKALMAPEGAGFLAFANDVSSEWVPRLSSWLSLPDPVEFLLSGQPDGHPNRKQPRPHDPTTIEGGSVNALGYAGLDASLDFLQAHGVEAIASHVQGLHDILEAGLENVGFTSLRSSDPARRSALLCFDPPQDLDLPDFVDRLGRKGISVSMPQGRLRFGLHLANSVEEARWTVQTIGELILEPASSPR